MTFKDRQLNFITFQAWKLNFLNPLNFLIAGHTNRRGKTQASFDCVRMIYILVQVNGIENTVKAIHITPNFLCRFNFQAKMP